MTQTSKLSPTQLGALQSIKETGTAWAYRGARPRTMAGLQDRGLISTWHADHRIGATVYVASITDAGVAAVAA